MVYACEQERSGLEEQAPILTVELTVEPAAAVVRLQGALKGSSIAALDAQVDQLGSAPCDEVVLDVVELTEVDELGAGLLGGLQHYVWARGGRVTVFGARPPLAAALVAAGLVFDCEGL